MAAVSFNRVEKNFGKFKIIHGISLDIADGEFVVMVGPSGCGKSTLLRMLAGLEEISGGEIAIDGRVVNEVDSKDRDIAMVFQSYALYPHMTVSDNLGFSLRLRKADKSLIGERVDERRAHPQPRCAAGALSRASSRAASASVSPWAAPSCAIPRCSCSTSRLSNLDAKLRVAMRAEIKALHQRLKTTTVYVTHDQIEAMTMADRIVVMHDGIVEQIGTPLELFDRPRNLFVAQFIGSPAMNVMAGTLRTGDGRAWIEAEGQRWPVAAMTQARDGLAVHYGVRPGDISVSTSGERHSGEGGRRRADRRGNRAAAGGGQGAARGRAARPHRRPAGRHRQPGHSRGQGARVRRRQRPPASACREPGAGRRDGCQRLRQERGRRAAGRDLGVPYVEGDSLHTPRNVALMAAGTPLTDDDRRGWLQALAGVLAAAAAQAQGVVVVVFGAQAPLPRHAAQRRAGHGA